MHAINEDVNVIAKSGIKEQQFILFVYMSNHINSSIHEYYEVLLPSYIFIYHA